MRYKHTQSTRYWAVNDSTFRCVDQDYVQVRSETLVGKGASHVPRQYNPGWRHINGPSAHQKPVGNDLWTAKQLPTKPALLPVLCNMSFRVELATPGTGARIKLLIYRLISITNLMHKFFYSITICMLHYNPRHASSINTPIFRRTNCIITASGIVTLCKRLYSMLDKSIQLLSSILYSRLQGVTIPDAVIIQFVLLKMGVLMLETCRGL